MKRVLCCFTVNPDYLEFAVPQLKSLLKPFPVPLQILLQEQLQGKQYAPHELNHNTLKNFPFAVLHVPEFEKRRAFYEHLSTEAVMTSKVLLLIADGSTYEEMYANSDQQLLDTLCRDQTSQVMCDFDSRNRTLVRQDQIQRIHQVLGKLDVRGKVNFKEPSIRYQLIEQHEWYHKHHETSLQTTLKHVYFGIELSCNKIAKAKFNYPYELSKRIYLGPTSTDNDLAFMMCNQALVGEGSLVIDPFVGTGGLLIPPASKKAVTFGSDLDIRVINGYAVGRINKKSPFYKVEDKLEIFTPKINLNFEQYGFPIPNIIRTDCTKLEMRHKEFFDAIITDPPYGIRAMSRSIATKKEEKTQEVEVQCDDKGSESQEEPETKELTPEQSAEIQRKRLKRRHLKENKKKRQEQLPEQEKQFKKDLLSRMNRERVEHWQKFDKGKIQTTQRVTIFQALLHFARSYLRPQGRLVFLYPVYQQEEYLGVSNLPSHDGFAVIDLSQNKMSKGNSRILVTLEKL